MAKESEDLVLTPGGRRQKQLVLRVEPGNAVRGNSITRASLVKKRGAAMARNLVLTPGGFRHPALVHRVEPGHAVNLGEGTTRLKNLATSALIELPKHIVGPGDVPGFGSGWIAYAAWLNQTGKPVTEFRTTWLVPAPPSTDSGQTIFLFNGIDPANTGTAILQPVLQWGPSHAGGGPFWSVASWYVMGNGQAFHTPLVPVNPGDELVGVMTLIDQANGLFSYQAEFEGIAGTQLPVQNVAELVWCNETLEAYQIAACSDYPAADMTAMGSIQVQTGTTAPAVNWAPQDQVTDCGQHAAVTVNAASGGEVDLYYRSPLVRIPWEEFAQHVQILFGVIHDEGGVAIVNGHVRVIPPRGPEYALFEAVAQGVAEVVRGFGVRGAVASSAVAGVPSSVERAGLELMARGLEKAKSAVDRALGEK